MSAAFAYHRMIVGYHGCERAVGEDALIAGTPLKRSANAWDWLGEGIYFWEHGPERALEFARWKQRRGQVVEPFVIGAYIHLGRCFDLTDTLATERLSTVYDVFRDDLASRGEALPENKSGGADDFDLVRRYLDCAVINFGLPLLERADGGTKFDTVRGVFTEGEAVFPGARIFKKTHVQVAVRDPACVLGFFKPAR